MRGARPGAWCSSVARRRGAFSGNRNGTSLGKQRPRPRTVRSPWAVSNLAFIKALNKTTTSNGNLRWLRWRLGQTGSRSSSRTSVRPRDAYMPDKPLAGRDGEGIGAIGHSGAEHGTGPRRVSGHVASSSSRSVYLCAKLLTADGIPCRSTIARRTPGVRSPWYYASP